jgi:hypothetical protein
MKINKEVISQVINDAVNAKYANDYFALQGFLDFCLVDMNISLDRLQKSAWKLFKIPAHVFYNTIERLGYHEYSN